MNSTGNYIPNIKITRRTITFLGTVEMLNRYAGLGNEPLDDILTDFYSKWYSANLMCLVVWGSGRYSHILDLNEGIIGSNSFQNNLRLI